MNNRIESSATLEEAAFDLSACAVEPEYFQGKLAQLEEQYKEQFPGGSREFLAAYVTGTTNPANLDYDEWAFLCEHFVRELAPPRESPPDLGVSSDQEARDNVSGFLFMGEVSCSTRNSTSTPYNTRFEILKLGLRRKR